MQKRNIYLYGLSFLVFLTVAIIRNGSFNQMHRFTHDVEHSREVIIHLEKLSNHFKSAQIYSQQYPDSSLRNIYQFYFEQARQIPNEVTKLRTLLSNEHPFPIQLDTVSAIIDRHRNALMQQDHTGPIHDGELIRLSDFFRAESMVRNMAEKEASRLQLR